MTKNTPTESFHLSDYESVIRKVLSKGSSFTFCPRGTSMEPTIRGGLDMVVLSPLPARLKRYQLILYKRDNSAFVLHRIIRLDGSCCTMRGDNQFVNEPGIRREQMIGIVTQIIRDGQTLNTESFRHRTAAWLWVHTALLRRVWRHLRSRIL